MKNIVRVVVNYIVANYIVVSCLLCFSPMMCSTLYAAPLVEIDTAKVQLDLPPYVDVLEDKGGRLTVEDVISERYAFQFAPASITGLFFGYTSSVYWLKFTTENQRDEAMHFVLEASPADIDYLDFFTVDPHTNQVVGHKRLGSAIPYTERIYDYPLYIFDLNIEAHTAYTYFLRVESDKTINLQLLLSTPHEYMHIAGTRDWWQGFLLGALLIAAAIHAGLFFLFRFKGFLWYSFFVVSVLGIQVSWNGYLLQFFSANALVLDRQILSPIYLAVCFSMLFAQSLLKTRKRSPVQHHMLSVVAILALTGTIATWFAPSQINSILASLLALLSIGLVFATTLHANMEGHNMARHFLIARTFTTGAVLVSIFNVHGYLPQGSFTAWGIASAIVAESIVLAISMGWVCLVNMRLSYSLSNEKNNDNRKNSLVNLSDICHELRTPISGVLGMADILLDGNITEQQSSQIKTIHRSGEALLDVTNKLSDLSSIERGDVELNATSFEMTDLIESCIENCRSRAEFNNIELIYHLDNNVAQFLMGDREKIQQSIINLLQFALRHVEHGEVVLDVIPGENKRVMFSIRSGNNTLLERNSLPYNREFGSSDHLNIVIAEQYIQLMEGSLSIRSFIDGGVHISFDIILDESRNKPGLGHDDNFVLQGRRMLIVDDNATCCSIIKQQASQWGMTAQTAYGGKEALAILRSGTTVDKFFDIVLIDYDMPGMNGLELASHINEDRNINSDNLLMVMLTGVSKTPGKNAAENSLIQRVLYKPLSGKSLKQALQAEMSKRGKTP
jgi:signal transduction histidine kinase/CheY-like chemotaxis protein